MRKASLAAAAVGASVTLAPVAAFAAWNSAGSGTGTAAATSVNRATAPTASRGNGTVALSWSAATLASGTAVAGYDVIRHVGSSTTTVCSYVTATSCADTTPIAGLASYGVVARIGANWQGPESPTTAFTYDDVAPTTTMTTSPVAPDGANGWFVHDVVVTLTATDTGSPAAGVGEIDYTIDSGTTRAVTGSTATFTVSAEKASQISYGAVDNLGNTETSHTATIKLDKTAPSSSISPPSGSTPLSATITATDGTSGVASITYRMDSGTNTTVNAATATVSVPSGAHTVSWTVTDTAGNTSTGSASYAPAAAAPAAPVISSCNVSNGNSDTSIAWTEAVNPTTFELRYQNSAQPTQIFAGNLRSGTLSAALNNTSGEFWLVAIGPGGTSTPSNHVAYQGNGGQRTCTVK